MTLSAGTKLGPYEVLSPLGAGGMGEVYRAKDARLDRDVAIKVLPELFSRDPERVQRFEREAKLLASLNHPNIAAIYGFEESDGKRLLVMELVEGQTLAEHLSEGPAPLDESLRLARQIAEALEAAHDSGVIHRDLKPANVKITPAGKVKVLDFGLAKAFSGDASVTDIANSPTISVDFTQRGVVLGTAAYMSPEQARGKPVDKRTDIWAFGVVLYECLTGQKLFGGETVSDSIGAILHKEPDWTFLPAGTPPTVHLLLRRCLAKDRDQRLHDIADARIELDTAIIDPSGSSLRFAESALSVTDSRKRSTSASLFRWIAVVVLAAVAAGTAWTLKPSSSPLGRILSQIPPPRDSRIFFAGDEAGPAVVSPDGSMIAFVAQQHGQRRQIWLRRLSENESRPLRGTTRATFPFWSHDSRSLGFFASGKLKRVDLATGTTLTLCDATAGRGGTWLNNDVIILATDFQVGLSRVSASGGTLEPVTELDASRHTSHRWPARVGDGNQFLFSAINHDPSKSERAAIYLGSLDGAPPRRVVQSLLNAEYTSGHMLFVRDTVLMAVPLDLKGGRMSGDPVAIATGISPDLSTWRAAFSASSAGVLAYHSVELTQNGEDPAGFVPLGVGAEANVIVQYSREGRPITQIAEGVSQADMRLSPDGKRLAVSVISDREFGIDLWIYRKHDPAPQRVTSMPFVEAAPVWSPDGTELAFSHMFVGDGKDAIYRKRIGGGVEVKLVETLDSSRQIWPTAWSPDGKYLVYTTGNWVGGLGADIHVLPLDGGDPFPYIATPDQENGARISPNGKWLAYGAGKGSVFEIYVVPFTPESRGADQGGSSAAPPTEKWQISVGGGESVPCWRADGKELFYIATDGALMAVAVDTEGDSFTVGATTRLFQTAYEPGKSFDVAPDGQSFFFNEVSVNVETPISLIVNWQERLNR